MRSKIKLAFAFWVLFIVLDLFKKSIWEKDENLIIYFYIPGIVLWFVFSIPMIRVSEKIYNLKIRSDLLMLAFSGLGIGLVKTVLALSFQWLTDPQVESAWWTFVTGSRPLYFVESVIIVWVFIGFLLIFDFYRRYVNKSKLAAELEMELSNAQLRTLRAQLEPHFLFNTLNTITALVKRNKSDQAMSALHGLSSLLRNVLNEKKQIISLEQELDLVKQYLEIETIRFQDRLTVEFDISEESKKSTLPSLILQPLIENAVKHGISKFLGNGYIRVSAVIEGKILVIEVYNSLPVVSENHEFEGNGIGLSNVGQRLMKIYGAKAALDINHNAEGVSVSLKIPLIHEEA